MTDYGLTRGEKALRRKVARRTIDHRRFGAFDVALWLAAVFFLGALTFAITVVFHFPVAVAADHADYRDVHTQAELCRYLAATGAKLTNVKNPCL